MKHLKLFLIALFAMAVAVSGCAKKSADQASISGTGFESLPSNEELAQLPQASTANPQSAIEALPIEASPVTQGASASIPSSIPQAIIDVASQSREQQIQAALKAAGFYQGNVDGKIGPASKKAIEAFQTANGLKADGKVGPKTWAALEKYLTGSPVSAGAGASSAQAQ